MTRGAMVSWAAGVARRLAFSWLVAIGAWVSASVAQAQNGFDGATVMVRKQLNDRWVLRGHGLVGYGMGDLDYVAGELNVGAGYNLSSEVILAVFTRASYADYRNLDNKDVELSVIESISWRRASGLFFGFYFEQRRLIYRPDGYAKSMSCCGGALGYGHTWERTGITGRMACHVICNMKSPNTKAEFVQRLKVPLAVSKRLNDRLSVGAGYTFSALGRRQPYIADCAKLNTFVVSVEFNL